MTMAKRYSYNKLTELLENKDKNFLIERIVDWFDSNELDEFIDYLIDEVRI